jgi:hypothetical protein
MSMTLVAHLHGAPDRLPFVGHFRVARNAGPVSVAVAGKVSGRGDVQEAFRAARTVETALMSVSLEQCVNRNDALNRIWDAMVAIEGCDLGVGLGNDLVALMAAQDESGMGIAGPGLGGVWAWESSELLPLVQGQHPLLGPPGRPDRLAGVLTLDAPCASVVAVAHDHPVPTLKLQGLARRCGVNP